MSDVGVGHSDEQVECKGNYHSLGEWRRLVSYQVAQSRRNGGHSNMTIGLVPTRSDVSASLSITMVGCVPSWVDIIAGPFIIVVGCVPAWVNVSAEIFHHCGRMCSGLGECVEIFHHCGRMCSGLGGSRSSLW